jgi:asparagine synthase (glutamine-hydrolysing)
MCGIAGFNWSDRHLIRRMTDALRHRGPDDEGFFVDPRISLGHRRLSILDLSEMGRQPMTYARGPHSVTVTFNGEIFNFREIRRLLEAKEYRFHTGTDTEIILAAYLEWGRECVHRFNGMWALALYDQGAGEIFLSRDRFGEKPLHYRLTDGRLIFASEIKAVLVHPVARRANPHAVSDYLYNGVANGRLDSFFADIYMLPPAHSAVFDLASRRMTLHKYYEPRRGNRRVPAGEFRETLRKAVERRLVSDVPVSISLSGGTDSTSIAALTAQLTDSPIKAFTTSSDTALGDETGLIAHFLERYPQFGLERSSLSESSFCQHYREIIFHMDEPFARQSAYVRWEIAHLTHQQGRKVLLNGEGADEILGGYVPFAPRFLIDLLSRVMLTRLAREVSAVLRHPERKQILEAFQKQIGSVTAGRLAQETRTGQLQAKFGLRLDPINGGSARSGNLKDYLFSLVHESSLPRLLNCNDKMTMANSVEGRAPFLDHEFVDMVFSMDTRDLLVSGWRKYPLRRAMQGLVPDEILFRKSKDAFHAPIFEYLRSESIERRIREIFQDACTSAILDPSAYLTEYERFLARQPSDRTFLLHGLFLEEWARMFDVEFA